MGTDRFDINGRPSEEEWALIDAIESGQAYWPERAKRRAKRTPLATISAGLIRAILLGLEIERRPAPRQRRGAHVPVSVLSFGIRIQPDARERPDGKAESWKDAPRVLIAGSLNLHGMVARGGMALPPLALEYCEFEAKIDMGGVSLSSLSLTGSRFSALRLCEAAIGGSVNLNWCGPRANPIKGADGKTRDQRDYWPFDGRTFTLEITQHRLARFVAVESGDLPPMLPGDAEVAECLIDLNNVRIDGGCNLSCSDFVRRRRHECEFSPTRELRNYAVELKGAHIIGDLSCVRTVIVGSMTLTSCDITEDAWFIGARLFAFSGSGGLALNLQNGRVGGALVFRWADADYSAAQPALKQRGHLLHNIIVGAMSGIGLTAKTFWLGASIVTQNATWKEDSEDETSGGWCRDAVFLEGAEIQANLKLGCWTPDQADEAATRIYGAVSLPNAHVGKCLELFHCGATGEDEPPVSGLLLMGDPFTTEFLGYRVPPSESHFSLLADGLTVDQHIRVGATHFAVSPITQFADYDDPACFDWITSISLWKATVARGLDIDPRCRLDGGLRLERVKIGRRVSVECSLNCGLSVTHGKVAPAIDGRGMVLDGDFSLGPGKSSGSSSALVVNGTIDLSGARIDGDCRMSQMQFQANPAPGATPAVPMRPTTMLSLAGANITGRLKIEQIGWAADLGASRQQDALLRIHAEQRIWFRKSERLSFRKLSCYPDYWLVDAVQANRFRRVLWRPRPARHFVPLDGQSAPVRELNDQGALVLETDQQRLDYLTFFCDVVHSELGSFRLVKRADENVLVGPADDANDTKDTDGAAAVSPPSSQPAAEPVNPEADLSSPADAVAKADFSKLAVGDLRQVGDAPDGWRFQGTILFDDKLFLAEFYLRRNGTIEMVDDLPVAPVSTVKELDKGEVRPCANPEGIEFHPVGLPPGQRQTKAAAQAGIALNEYFDARNVESKLVVARHRVDLGMLSCGYLDDDFGCGWGMAPGHFKLGAAGIQCVNVEPAGEAKGGAGADASVESGMAVEAFAEEARVAEVRKIRDAARHRARWLALQFSRRRPGVPQDGFWRRALSNLKSDTVNDAEFVPQTWDMFANAHMRAGEAGTARYLLTERKDIEAFLRAGRVHQWLGRPAWRTEGFAESDRGGTFDLPHLRRRTLLWILLAVVGLSTVGWFIGSAAGLPLDTDRTIFILACGLTAGALLMLLSPWLSLTGDWLFRTGFRYGLSPWHAVATLALMLGIGTVGTHLARTGEPLSTRTDWGALTTADGLDPRIALVLNVGYGADRREPQTSLPNRGLPGEAIYAAPTPCNLGVSSFVYAVDVFIPVLDLGQEARCAIREELENDRNYFLWRLAKMIYQILGWIITSLTILTVSGVMRRDVER